MKYPLSVLNNFINLVELQSRSTYQNANEAGISFNIPCNVFTLTDKIKGNLNGNGYDLAYFTPEDRSQASFLNFTPIIFCQNVFSTMLEKDTIIS